MGHGYEMIGFVVITILYVVIGVMAARGTIGIFRKIFAPKSEQIFYAVFLMVIAVLYLAFAGYFGAAPALPVEATAVAAFVAIALLGMRQPFALMVGYSLHGVWDLLHELQSHGGPFAFPPGELTAIPLAYGFFCLAFDFYMVGYFYGRRLEWRAAR